MSNPSERESLSLALGYVIRHLEDNGYLYVGVVRRAARTLVELQARPTDADMPSCPSCGGEVVRSGTVGRPRIYCGRACRNAARYRAKL